MTAAAEKVKPQIVRPDTDNVNRLAWQSGFTGVAGLARHLGCNRVTVWKAVRWPDQFQPTFIRICEALNAN